MLRGARQVGKTYLIRQFASENFDAIIEYNFDKSPEKASLFESSDLSEVISLISIDSGVKVVPGKVILFLDEIQAAPEIIAKGTGFIAARIKEIAIENDIYITENKGLARELYKRVEIGDMIPEDLFQAVAELLAFVFRLKKRAV